MKGLEERLRLALEGTETGFWEWEIASDTVEWSENVGPMHGLERGAQPRDADGYLNRFVHREERARVGELIRAAVDEGSSYEHDLRIALPDGGDRFLHSRVHAVKGADGRTERLIGLLTDVTDRRRREDRRAFLSEASAALAASLDPVETLEEVARLAVPRLADWCSVQLAPEVRGAFEQIAVAHVDPEKVRWAWELAERYPPDPEARTGAPAVIRSGRAELYPVIDEALLEAAALDDEQRCLVRELHMHSAMVVPLSARGRTLGAVTFVFAESGRQYSTSELELAEELGRRAGLALDHARLYAREHATAETLQRALLPPVLPEVPGHRLIVRYVPSDERDHVGGDWYDAFRLPGGRFGIAIGDVGGRGMAAAATMGQLRNALRAYALKGDRPAEVVDDLHALVDAGDGEIAFATLLYLELDPATGEGELAVAGHLPPLVVAADGTAGYLEIHRCPPLGASGAPPCHSTRFTLAPGATLWLYTDGLVESRSQPIDAGLSGLAAAARGDGDLDTVADALLAALPGSREDDVALLGLERIEPPG
jgi:serine phosphatase RsbU (regulator of sigma subunit)